MSNFEKLKLLLLGPEQQRIERLDGRLKKLETHRSNLAEELPDAIQELSDDSAFQASLDKPVTKTLYKAIRRDTASFAELLFPVIGPAVRRAVADAMRSLVQRINITLEQRLSVKALRWRMEAARTGLPVAQLILRDTMLYSVQEVFLIHSESGLVIQRASRIPMLALDQDAVSSMLTAIQSFIQDSLGAGSDEQLRSAELATNTLWVINAPGAILACVISGQPPRELRDELIESLEGLQIRHGEKFDRLAGSNKVDPVLKAELAACLLEQQQEESRKSSRPTLIKLGIAALAVIALATWLGYIAYTKGQRLEETTRLFSGAEGIVISQSSWVDGKMVLEGLRDPMAVSVAEVIAGSEEDPEDIITRFEPYYSLEPQLIINRVRQQIDAPDDLTLKTEGRVLVVEQPIQPEMAHRIRALIETHPVIASARMTIISEPEEDLEELVRQELAIPVDLAVTVETDVIHVSGFAPLDYLQNSILISEHRGRAVNWERAWPAGFSTVLEELERVHDSALYFTENLVLTDSSMDRLDELAADLIAIEKATPEAIRLINLRVLGLTDPTGSDTFNANLRLARAEAVIDQLVNRGVTRDWLIADGSLSSQESATRRLVLLRFEVP